MASKESSMFFTDRLVYWLGLLFVVIGLINVTPAIPGWDEFWKYLTGNDFFRVRRFPTEWFYPCIFLDDVDCSAKAINVEKLG